jgi:hypothetical protein
MIQIYIKHTDNNFYLLDVEPTELINFKLTSKDLTDISKIFSPFTQSFNLKATDKNKILCGFIGNEKIQRANLTGEFDSMIYISGFLFQSGKITFDESDYELQDQKTLKTSFASNLTSLTDRLGDTTIQTLFQDADGAFDEAVKVEWNYITLRDRMKSIINVLIPSTNIAMRFGIPFISNNRVFTYDKNNLDVVDNIAFKQIRTATTVNQISLAEVRPAVSFMTIMDHLVLKIGTPIICPIFERPEVRDIFVWCSSESLVVPDAKAFPLINYNPIVALRYDFKRESGAINVPDLANVKWLMTSNPSTGVFKCDRNNANSGEQGGWSDGFDVNVIFNNLISLEGQETKIKVNLINNATGIILDSQEIDGNIFTSRITDSRSENPTMLNANGEIFLRVEILPITLLKWDFLQYQTIQRFDYPRRNIFGPREARANYSHTSSNYTESSTLGGNKFNLITALPKKKCTDFLRDFFKTFNISVVSTGLPDQSMYWLTPDDIQENNKPYSKRIVDYTSYVDIATLNKKKANEYNLYSFTHFASKYFDGTYFNGEVFGSLVYPLVTVPKPTKYEIKTEYSIMNQRILISHPSGVKSCYGFSKDTPTVLDSGAVRYKPVYEEFTLFYLQSRGLDFNPVSIEYTPTINQPLYGVLEASYRNSFNGKTLAFGAIGIDTDSLFLNYYNSFIELLLDANTYKSEFVLNLPANEIFLNFSNLNQGESNIPTGFRAQNEFIISEQRYQLVDVAISLTDGKTKLTGLNF